MQKRKKNLRLWNKNTNNIKWKNGRYYGIIKSLEYSGLLLKGVSETTQNEAKEQK